MSDEPELQLEAADEGTPKRKVKGIHPVDEMPDNWTNRMWAIYQWKWAAYPSAWIGKQLGFNRSTIEKDIAEIRRLNGKDWIPTQKELKAALGSTPTAYV